MINGVKTAILPKAIYKFIVMPIKILKQFFTKKILLHMETQKSQNNWKNSEY